MPCLALHDTMKYIGSDVGTVGFGGCLGMAGKNYIILFHIILLYAFIFRYLTLLYNYHLYTVHQLFADGIPIHNIISYTIIEVIR